MWSAEVHLLLLPPMPSAPSAVTLKGTFSKFAAAALVLLLLPWLC
jgi:hypothetical protein